MKHLRAISRAAGVFTFLICLATNATSKPIFSETEVRQSYLTHGVKAQLHRWYQYYENKKVGVQNQLDILAKDIKIISSNGTAEGHEAYIAAVTQLPATWQNSHDLKSTKVTVREDGTLGLIAKITYQNVGMLEGDKVRSLNISYDADLKSTNSVLPVFTRIAIETGAPVEAKKFHDLYAKNRLLSLVHYWMAMVEHPERKAEPFREVLASKLDIDFGSGPIVDYEGLRKWIAGPASSVSASRHDVKNFKFRALGENKYELNIELDWVGIRPDDVWMTAKTRHTWLVEDDPKERFARIAKIRVKVLEPFKVVE